MKKNIRIVICLLVSGVLGMAVGSASEAQFKVTLSGIDLVVSNTQGTPVSIVPLATIGRSIDIPPVSFQISFGRDVHDNFSAIISPNPDHPTSLDFEIFGHQISMDKGSLVTCTLGQDSSQLVFDPGFLGQVKLDGKIITSMTALGGSRTPTAVPNTMAQPKPAPVVTPAPAAPAPATPAAPKTTPTMVSTPEPAATPALIASPVAPGTPSVELASDFRGQNPGVNLVNVGPAKEVTADDIAQMQASGQVAQKQLYWAEPVTPPDASQAPVVASNEIKLAEVRGDVQITSPQGKTTPAKDGMTIDSASTLTAGPNSSTAVLMGGVNSVRLTPNTIATVSSSLTGDTRTTRIDLKTGTVFNKVGQHDGEKQDYQVQSPSGVAAARGTDFSSTFTTDGRMITMVAQGVVEVFDSGGKLAGTAAPQQARTLAYISVGGTPATQGRQSQDILQVLAVASQINNKVNSLLEAEAGGQTLTSAQQSYLLKVAVVELAVLPIPVNDPILLTRQLPPPALIQQVLASIPTQAPPVANAQTNQPPPNSKVPDPTGQSVTVATAVTVTPTFNPAALITNF